MFALRGWFRSAAGRTPLHDEATPKPSPARPRVHSPRMNIGFKEWTLVCDALGRGEQSIILRKGGIAEGRAGFRFQHPEFLLLPTLFHEIGRAHV